MEMSFSQRKGLKPVKETLQIDSMDYDLRSRLWDIVSPQLKIGQLLQTPFGLANPEVRSPIMHLWHRYFKWPQDTIPEHGINIAQIIRDYFFKCKWNEVYDFIEFIARWVSYPDGFQQRCNKILEEEVSGYRFTNGIITPITGKEEIQEIEKAIDHVSPDSNHLRRALELLSDRKSPDYRNSIKESISAVEAMCRSLAQDDKATLGDALKKVSKKYPIHLALQGAFSKLYGYTNGASGARHSMTDKAVVVRSEDARFMLVSCSAFVNYLRVKAEKNSNV